MRKVGLFCVALALFPFGVSPQQSPVQQQRPLFEAPDPGLPHPFARPAYPQDKGPVVVIDQTHRNTHTYAGRQRGFVELVQGDGYRVRPLTEAISNESLKGVDVLVLINPGGWDGPEFSLKDDEVAALVEWVRHGGSLLLVLDHMPYPGNNTKLAAALGVTHWHNGYAMVDIPDALPVGAINFRRADASAAESTVTTLPGGRFTYQGADAILSKHLITQGRAEEERVVSVTTFVGSAFQPPKGAETLLLLPPQAISLMPEVPGGADVRATKARAPVGEWLQGAVMKLGKGRVALFGEIGLFSGGPAADNRKFVLNVMRWLSGFL